MDVDELILKGEEKEKEAFEDDEECLLDATTESPDMDATMQSLRNTEPSQEFTEDSSDTLEQKERKS